MTITLTREAEQELEQEAAQRNLTPDQVAAQALLAGLRGQRTPQTLAELPQRPLPEGKTLLNLFEEFWRDHPSTETDEEVATALKALR